MVESLPEDFAKAHSRLLRELLWKRGFRTDSEVEEFLSPSLSKVPNPIGQLLDLEEALRLTLAAKESKWEITVFGDYDVDGSTSSVLLVRALRDWGFRVQLFIPHRVEDGYGLTKKAVESCLAKYPNTRLVISCDCGVSSYEGVALLRSRGVEVIVTDHHEPPPERVEASAILNPKQKACPYPAKNLAGVGVAFVFLLALRKALNRSDYSLRPLLDLVALGTICDLAELTGVNRILVKHGLQVLESQARPGVKALCEISGHQGSRLRAKDVGFLLGPRINASGRVGLPDRGAHALLSPDLASARQLARELDMANRLRRQMQEAQTEEALRMADEMIRRNPERSSLVIASKDFHLGVVGLIASRLADRYKRPVAALTFVDDEHFLADYPGRSGLWKGSLRSPVGFHLADALQKISKLEPALMISFGGHALAAGVTLDETAVDQFGKMFEIEASQVSNEKAVLIHEAVLDPESDLLNLIDQMEPFGQGNPQPLLLMPSARLNRVQIMKEEHLKLFVDLKGQNFSVLQFRSPWVSLAKEWGEGISHRRDQIAFDAFVELSENEWNGRRSVELVLREVLNIKRNGEYHDLSQAEVKRANEIGASPRL